MSKKIKTETIYQIIEKLTGDIEPVGSHDFDEDVLRNVKQRIKLFNMMLSDLTNLVNHKHDSRESVKNVGRIVSNELKERVKFLNEFLIEEENK